MFELRSISSAMSTIPTVHCRLH